MKSLGVLLAVASGLAGAALCAADAPVARVEAVSKGYKLTFSDEFSGATLDQTKWIDSYPDNKRTHENNEQEYYAPDGWAVQNGLLVFKAEKRSMGGKPYTSGMVSSYGKFSQKYGWFEARMKVPGSQGMWPAFWMLPATRKWPPEIDIMELIGREKNKVYLTLHEKQAGTWRPKSFGQAFEATDFTTDFHTYAVEWTPGELVWYVDGVERHHVKDAGVPDEPMYILLNLAVGGDWPRMPDQTTVLPSTMQIDYVRVYQKPDAAKAN